MGKESLFLPVFFLNQETALIMRVGAISMAYQGTEMGLGGSICCHSDYLAVTNECYSLFEKLCSSLAGFSGFSTLPRLKTISKLEGKKTPVF